jgi:hypothetical protein
MACIRTLHLTDKAIIKQLMKKDSANAITAKEEERS